MFTKQYHLMPLKGTEQLNFGSNREDLRKIFSTYRMSFNRDHYVVDDYRDFHAYFDNGLLCAIEFFETCEVLFSNQQLMGMNFEVCKNLFLQYDKDLRVEGSVGFTSSKLQIGVYASCKVIETVLIAKEGYYQ